MATARIAEILARDPHPLVLGGSRQHLLQQVAIASLELLLPLQGIAGLRDPVGKRVANPLELLESGNAGLSNARRDSGVEGEARKSLGAKAG